ncbi:MAG: hypothetical protein AB8D78_03160 [Akkermansiaceae bacterium]
MNLAKHLIGLFRLLICMAAVIMPAHAQAPTVKLQFVSFPKVASPEPVELFLGEGKTMEVELPTNSISETYEVPVLSMWVLGESSTNEDGDFVFKDWGKARSNGAKNQLILVIRKGRDDADGFELVPMQSGADGFGGGKYLLVNAAKVDVAGSIGTSKFALKPNANQLIAPGPTKTKGNRKYCFAKIYFRKGEEVQSFFSSTWRFNEAARSMVFFYHDPNTGKLRLHTIRSFR